MWLSFFRHITIGFMRMLQKKEITQILKSDSQCAYILFYMPLTRYWKSNDSQISITYENRYKLKKQNPQIGTQFQ